LNVPTQTSITSIIFTNTNPDDHNQVRIKKLKGTKSQIEKSCKSELGTALFVGLVDLYFAIILIKQTAKIRKIKDYISGATRVKMLGRDCGHHLTLHEK